MSDEIERIKERHRLLHDTIHGQEFKNGERVYLHGARLGQIGVSPAFIDEVGNLWRFGQDGSGEYLEAVVDEVNFVVQEDPQATAAVNQSFSEHDPDVKNRAKHGADAPYDQRTCAIYPWAAAARITFLEQEVYRLKTRETQLKSNLRGLVEIYDGGK